MSNLAARSALILAPRIIYGTAWKKADTARLVRTAILLGFRGVDTACQPKHYNEAGVGAGVVECLNHGVTRAELYLQTKFTPVSGQDPANVPYDPRASLREQLLQSFAASLRNLRTDYLDCLLIHSPLANANQTLEVWRSIESLMEVGGIRQAGISNCYRLEQLESLYRSAQIKPAVVQNRFYSETGYDREIRAFCRAQQIVYQSFWTLTANPHICSHATIATLALKYGRTPAQILFRYLTQSAVVPLTGTSSEAHMRDDLAILDFELADSECEALSALF
jgi:diketogulonate reductase-like aldo/keto reductase